MKILFINPPFAKYSGIEGHGGKAAPLNLGYLASYTRQQKPKIEVDILDCEGLNLSFDQIKEYLNKSRPDIAALTMPTPAYKYVMSVIDEIKSLNKKTIVVVGGPHPTGIPKNVMEEKILILQSLVKAR